MHRVRARRPRGWSHRPLLAFVAITIVLAVGCSSGSGGDDDAGDDALIELDEPARRYEAEWLVSAEAVGVAGPGFPFAYREVVDDATGRYLVQSPAHVATQEPESVVFCAAIYRSDPYCAATERPEGSPPVLSYPIQLLRTWGPVELYDLASWREVDLAARTEPDAWTRRSSIIADVPAECFAVVGDTAAARTGFEICFIDDDLHMVASVDLQGDLIYEIDLISYTRVVSDEAFTTGLDEFVEAKQSLQDQLITLFPEIPAPRPTPTPNPDDES